jgi:hypothetical protein
MRTRRVEAHGIYPGNQVELPPAIPRRPLSVFNNPKLPSFRSRLSCVGGASTDALKNWS